MRIVSRVVLVVACVVVLVLAGVGLDAVLHVVGGW